MGKERVLYNEKIKTYISLIDKECLNDVMLLVSTLGSGCSVIYNQLIKTDGFEGTVQINISQRNKMWEFNVTYNGRFMTDIRQALLIIRDTIYVEWGWQTKEQFADDWGYLEL